MKILFRQLAGSAAPSPGTGELFVQAASAEFDKRIDLAALVVGQGVASLRQAAGPIETIVLRSDPTLDDLLAATFAGELLAGRTLPAGAEAFARYAALVREGLAPSTVSPEASLEGIFKAIRNAAGDDLTDPIAGRRFTADWARMERVILQAAADGKDPFTTPLFAEGSEFARERAFLAKDREVYRQDMLRGEQWTVSIPGGPPLGRALLLRQPKSLLFKQWSRSAADSGAGQPFVFLAVAEEPGQWIFSTDPVQRLPIDSLAEALQIAEIAFNPERAAQDPWFDGQPFDYTLVAAPRGGTVLSETQVLRIVRHWARASSSASRLLRWLVPAAALLVLCVGLSLLNRNARPVEAARGLEFFRVSDETAQDPIAPREGKDYALLFASDAYDHWPALYNAEADAKKIGDVLHDDYGFEVDPCFGYTKKQFIERISEYVNKKSFGPNDQLFIYIAGHGDRIGKKGYLVSKTSPSPGAKPEDKIDSYYPLAELKDDVEKIHCGHVFLVLDTCFGGMIDFQVAVKEETKRGRETNLDPVPKARILRKMKLHCCAFLTSVGREPALDGERGTHSPFAKHLINVLESAKPRNLVAIPNIIVEVNGDESQEPCYGFLQGSEQGGDFLFIRQQ